MRKIITLGLLLCFSFGVSAQIRFTDFETGVPAYFSTDATTSLTTSNEHVKSGTKSVKWVATDNKAMTATGLNIAPSEVGSSTASSAQLYVYNSEASEDKLIFEFLDNSGVVHRANAS